MGSIPVGELKILHASLAKKREDEGRSNRMKEEEGIGTSLGNVFGRQNQPGLDVGREREGRGKDDSSREGRSRWEKDSDFNSGYAEFEILRRFQAESSSRQ